mmetsp:Transcript_65614/g.104542  ORF Transcript_65614/g.104542 Transcript_65614/m.104542 type:complete len:104 (+) Transcript_65614:23-334(+)
MAEQKQEATASNNNDEVTPSPKLVGKRFVGSTSEKGTYVQVYQSKAHIKGGGLDGDFAITWLNPFTFQVPDYYGSIFTYDESTNTKGLHERNKEGEDYKWPAA